jgi:anti-anti-sigma regulatory factor
MSEPQGGATGIPTGAPVDSLEPVKLGASLGIAQAETLRTTLLETLSSGQPVVLDASEVASVDACIVQLLVSYVKTARARETPVSWASPSEALHDGASLLDLAEALALPAKGA